VVPGSGKSFHGNVGYVPGPLLLWSGVAPGDTAREEDAGLDRVPGGSGWIFGNHPENTRPPEPSGGCPR